MGSHKKKNDLNECTSCLGYNHNRYQTTLLLITFNFIHRIDVQTLILHIQGMCSLMGIFDGITVLCHQNSPIASERIIIVLICLITIVVPP